MLFCWGDDNNDKDTIKHLKSLGIHAIIYDKVDILSSKGVKVNILLKVFYASTRFFVHHLPRHIYVDFAMVYFKNSTLLTIFHKFPLHYSIVLYSVLSKRL